jgi:hypothetical protein
MISFRAVRGQVPSLLVGVVPTIPASWRVGTKTAVPLYYNYEPRPLDVIEKVRKIEAVCDPP